MYSALMLQSYMLQSNDTKNLSFWFVSIWDREREQLMASNLEYDWGEGVSGGRKFLPDK